MANPRYDHWPFAWRAVAAEAVTRHGSRGQRHTTTATLSTIAPATIRRCVCADLQRAHMHPDKYTPGQVAHLVAVARLIPEPVQCYPIGGRDG